MQNWEQLRKHIVNHGIILGDTVAGKRYQFFLDIRQALQTSGYLKIAGQLMRNKIKSYQPEVIVGLGLGAANLLLATQIAAEDEGYKLSTLIGRDRRKQRNRRKIFEGPLVRQYARAIYIDDAFNTGSTYFKCMKLLEQENLRLEIRAACVLYDFWNHKGSRKLEILGLPFLRVYTRHDMGLTRIDPKDSPVESKLLWRNLAYNQWPQWLKAPPIIHEDKIIFVNDRHEVYCHLLNGDLVWHWSGPNPNVAKGVSARPIVADNKVLISSYDGSIYCLDLDHGHCIWSRPVDMFLHSTPFVNGNELYLGTEGGLHLKRGDIICQDLNTGEVKWRFPTNDVIPGSPMLVENQVICGSNDGYLYSLTDGKLNWALYVGLVKGRVNILGNIIVCSTEEGYIYGISKTGKFIWSRSCGTKTIHQFCPVHDSGLVYIINQDHNCIAYNERGDQVWIRKLRGPGFYNLTLHKDELLAITENGYAVVMCALTGEKKKQSWLRYKVTCPAAFNDDLIVVHSQTKGLFVYQRG